MDSLTKTQWLILNATTDDFEDLERIYRTVSLEFSAEKYNPSDANSFYWRETSDPVPLSEIVEAIRRLVDDGLLSVNVPDTAAPLDTTTDLSYLWRGWFKATPKGSARLVSWESVK